MRFGKLKLDRCRYGWMLHKGPYIGKCFELYGEYSEAEVDVMRVFLRSGDTGLDIGANIGDLTLPMAQIVGPKGRVFAIESHSDTFQILNANLALNEITNVKALNHFVADSADVDMSGAWGDYGYVSQTWRPSTVAIDDLDLENCAFIKVDVDGKECEIIRSGAKTIARHRPIIYFENDDHESSPRLLECVLDQDYAIYFHSAPIWKPDNYFGNPVNHWAPTAIVSLMMLAVPKERDGELSLRLPKVSKVTDWWQFLEQAPVNSEA